MEAKRVAEKERKRARGGRYDGKVEGRGHVARRRHRCRQPIADGTTKLAMLKA